MAIILVVEILLASLSLSQSTEPWVLHVADGNDPVYIALKICYMLLCLYYVMFQKPPRLGSAPKAYLEGAYFLESVMAVNRSGFMIKRQGSDQFVAIGPADAIYEQIAAGQVVANGGDGNLSVLTREMIDVDDVDVILSGWLGRERTTRLAALLATMMGADNGLVYAALWLIAGVGGIALVGVIITSTGDSLDLISVIKQLRVGAAHWHFCLPCCAASARADVLVPVARFLQHFLDRCLCHCAWRRTRARPSVDLGFVNADVG